MRLRLCRAREREEEVHRQEAASRRDRPGLGAMGRPCSAPPAHTIHRRRLAAASCNSRNGQWIECFMESSDVLRVETWRLETGR